MVSEAYYTYFATRGVCDERLVDMAKALGKVDAKEPMDFVDALLTLQKLCEVDDLKMSDYGIVPEDLRKYAENAKDTMGGLFEVDPAPLSVDDAEEILKRSYR